MNSPNSQFFDTKTLKSLNVHLAHSAQQTVRDKALATLVENLTAKNMWFEQSEKQADSRQKSLRMLWEGLFFSK